MNKRKLYSSETGFSLIEVTIGLVVTTILLITISFIVNFFVKANLQSQETVNDVQEGRRVMDVITNEIKFSDNYNSNQIIIEEYLNENEEVVSKSLEYVNSNNQNSKIYLSHIDDKVYMETDSDKIPLSSGSYITNLNFEFDPNDETNNTIIITIQLKNNTFSTTVRPLNPKPPEL